jgi:hypothetical protein
MAGRARGGIVEALVTKLKLIDGSGTYNSDLASNVTNKLVFWDEVNDFPYLSVTAGNEVREYLPGNSFKWGILGITVRMYVQGEDPVNELEKVFTDVEEIIDNNNQLTYDVGKTTQEIRIQSITSDEGLLAPFGVGEITLEVKYQVM